MFGSRELLMGDVSIPVFVLMVEDFFCDLVRILAIFNLLSWQLHLDVFKNLFFRQMFIAVAIDLLEHVHHRRRVTNGNKFNLEYKSGTRRNDVAGAAVAVAELRGDGEAVLVAGAHVHQALVPALDHLAHAQLEGEGLVAVHAGIKLLSIRCQCSRVVHC